MDVSTAETAFLSNLPLPTCNKDMAYYSKWRKNKLKEFACVHLSHTVFGMHIAEREAVLERRFGFFYCKLMPVGTQRNLTRISVISFVQWSQTFLLYTRRQAATKNTEVTTVTQIYTNWEYLPAFIRLEILELSVCRF